MKKKSYLFNGEDLIQSAQEGLNALKNNASLREKKLPIPPPVHKITPKTISKTRHELGFTQNDFAKFLNVPLITLVSWERGARKPSGAALRLLDITARNPSLAFKSYFHNSI